MIQRSYRQYALVRADRAEDWADEQLETVGSAVPGGVVGSGHAAGLHAAQNPARKPGAKKPDRASSCCLWWTLVCTGERLFRDPELKPVPVRKQKVLLDPPSTAASARFPRLNTFVLFSFVPLALSSGPHGQKSTRMLCRRLFVAAKPLICARPECSRRCDFVAKRTGTGMPSC